MTKPYDFVLMYMQQLEHKAHNSFLKLVTLNQLPHSPIWRLHEYSCNAFTPVTVWPCFKAEKIISSSRRYLVGHKKKEISEGKRELVIIPEGFISVLQLLDISVNKSVNNIKRVCRYWMINGNKEKFDLKKEGIHVWN